MTDDYKTSLRPVIGAVSILGGQLEGSLDLNIGPILKSGHQGPVDEAGVHRISDIVRVVGGDVLRDVGEGAAVPLIEGLDGALDHFRLGRVGGPVLHICQKLLLEVIRILDGVGDRFLETAPS